MIVDVGHGRAARPQIDWWTDGETKVSRELLALCFKAAKAGGRFEDDPAAFLDVTRQACHQRIR